MIRQRAPIRRSVIRIDSARKKGEPINLKWRAWLHAWPCFVCFRQHCLNYGIPFAEACTKLEAREYYKRNWSLEICGRTESAHVGSKGVGQKCPEREMMPLGFRHHRHPVAGGFPDSHHAGTKTFWDKHGLSRSEALEFLRHLYLEETGCEI